MQIDAHKRTLGEVLQLGQHMIPRYQRRYAWIDQNIRDFWNDITNAETTHFLGSMVTSGATSEPREVIDGQQRLTTTLISLCVLRDHYQDRDQNQRVTGINAYLEFNDRNGIQRSRLQNRDTAAAARLNDNVIVEPARRKNSPAYDEESNESQAYSVFSQLTSQALKNSENEIESLDLIRDAILETEVVYISVEDRKTAITIFETLNDRGRSLTVMDLVKNHLFAAIVESDENSSERLWVDTLELVEQVTFEHLSPDGFLYYAWNSKDHKGHNRADTIETARLRRSIADLVTTSANPAHTAQQVIEDFNRDARILVALDHVLSHNGDPKCWDQFDPNWRRDKYEEISDRIYGILVTGSNQPIPLLLALLNTFLSDRNILNRKLLLRFLVAVERFQFRWTIAQKASTSSIRRMYRFASSSVSGAVTRADIESALNAFIENAAKIDASDAQFRDGIGRLAYSQTRGKDAFKIRHILTQLEKMLPETKLDLGRQMSIEHLQGLEGRSEQTPRNAWIFKIGNLVLVPTEVNSRLPRAFDDKCDTLKDWVNPSDRCLSDAIAAGSWRSADAGDRLTSIVGSALIRWPGVRP